MLFVMADGGQLLHWIDELLKFDKVKTDGNILECRVTSPRVKARLLRQCLSLAIACGTGGTSPLAAQEPAGLAASALADTSFDWIRRSPPGIRAYFLADSYPAAHQDSLLERLPRALSKAQELIAAPSLDAPLDVFFVENRSQMTRLIGARATGFAEPATRTVILMTNPAWRAFERHEVMHVVAQQAWGPPAHGNDWLVEGLAQAADGMCAGYTNADVVLALTERHGWIPLSMLITRFREQSDLRAYLQAAAFVGHLLEEYGPAAIAGLWRNGSASHSMIGAETLAAIERRWRAELRPRHQVEANVFAAIQSEGCGVPSR